MGTNNNYWTRISGVLSLVMLDEGTRRVWSWNDAGQRTVTDILLNGVIPVPFVKRGCFYYPPKGEKVVKADNYVVAAVLACMSGLGYVGAKAWPEVVDGLSGIKVPAELGVTDDQPLIGDDRDEVMSDYSKFTLGGRNISYQAAYRVLLMANGQNVGRELYNNILIGGEKGDGPVKCGVFYNVSWAEYDATWTPEEGFKLLS